MDRSENKILISRAFCDNNMYSTINSFKAKWQIDKDSSTEVLMISVFTFCFIFFFGSREPIIKANWNSTMTMTNALCKCDCKLCVQMKSKANFVCTIQSTALTQKIKRSKAK